MSRTFDFRLLASGQRVAVVLSGDEVIAVHLERHRLTVEELEELYTRVQDADFGTQEEES